MKKIQPKYAVIRELTESEIKAIASSKWMNKNIYLIFAPIVICFLIAVIISKTMINDSGTFVFGLCSAVWFVIFATKYYKAGKKFWNSVKDKTQPIKM
jgi:hypothetical protein